MRTRLLRPSWLFLHVLVLVGLVVMVRLGGWQWSRGGDLDSIRNYSYGLEWWAFAALSLVGYVKICLDETVPAAQQETAEPSVEAPGAGGWPGAAAHAGSAALFAGLDADDDDPELAAWNAHLVELARRDAASGRS